MRAALTSPRSFAPSEFSNYAIQNHLAAVLPAVVVAALPAETLSKRSVDFNWGSTKVRGLNIGGWLLLKPWITPSIFQALDPSREIVDEYTLTEKLGTDAAYSILKPHWDSWCTFSDFQKIAILACSLESGEPYTQGTAPYIDAAIEWARATGLKVWIDLHGAPLSQNGFDNSRHKVSTPGWQGGDSTAQTLSVLNTITKNSALNFEKLKQFYRDGFDQVRAVSDTPVMLHDAFVTPKTWKGFLSVSVKNSHNVVVDHHEYQVFTNEVVALQPLEHRQLVCNNVASYTSETDKWVVVGEWTAAMTDCAPALNGYGIGARYDGTYPDSSYVGQCDDKNNIANWNETFKSDMRGYLEAQLSAFEGQSQGWVFWNFKTEAAHERDAFVLLDEGIFPQRLEDRDFGAICF